MCNSNNITFSFSPRSYWPVQLRRFVLPCYGPRGITSLSNFRHRCLVRLFMYLVFHHFTILGLIGQFNFNDLSFRVVVHGTSSLLSSFRHRCLVHTNMYLSILPNELGYVVFLRTYWPARAVWSVMPCGSPRDIIHIIYTSAIIACTSSKYLYCFQ